MSKAGLPAAVSDLRAIFTGKPRRPQRVLAVMLEFDKWSAGRTWSYLASYALLDGFEACGMEWTLLPSLFSYANRDVNPWVDARETLLAGQRFDQAWVWLTHAHYPADFWAWLETIAPVRVGVLMESLRYTPEEIVSWTGYARRFAEAVGQTRRLTHVLSYDEQDVAELAQATGLPTRLYHSMIPAQMVRDAPAPAGGDVLFLGSLYDKRQAFLAKAQLGDRVRMLASPEESAGLDAAFDTAHADALQALAAGRMTPEAMKAFALRLRTLRRTLLDNVLDLYRGGIAVLNLPAYFKGFPGRVVEALAAGVPVVTNRLDRRPQTEAAFDHGRHIIYYDAEDAGDLARQLDALGADPALRQALVANGRARLLQSLTSEVQMPALQAWIARTAQTPLQRWIAKIRPARRPAPASLAWRNGAPTKPLDAYKGLKTRTGAWSRRMVGGMEPRPLIEDDPDQAWVFLTEAWAVGLLAPVGDMLVGGADWLVIELFGLTAPIVASLLDAGAGAGAVRVLTPAGYESVEIWLRADRRTDTLVIQAAATSVPSLRLGRLRAVWGGLAGADRGPALDAVEDEAACAAQLRLALQAYRAGDRQAPGPLGRDLLLRDDGVATRLDAAPTASVRSLTLGPETVWAPPGGTAAAAGEGVSIAAAADAAPWTYAAAIDISARLSPGRQALVVNIGAVDREFGLGLANKDHSAFVQRWMVSAGLDSLEAWFDIADPADISALVVQHADPGFEGPLTIERLSVVQPYKDA